MGGDLRINGNDQWIGGTWMGWDGTRVVFLGREGMRRVIATRGMDGWIQGHGGTGGGLD